MARAKTRTVLDYALEYAKKGWHILPIVQGSKLPLAACVPHGVNDATTDVKKITEWFTNYPDANIAVACGPSGLAVVDLDVKKANGVENWQAWCAANEVSPNDTLRAKTPSGGEHLVYAGSCASTSNRIAPGIDTRGLGGYFLIEPSTIGEARYCWLEEGVLPAPLPSEVARMVQGRAPKDIAQQVVTPREGVASLLDLLSQDKIPLDRKATVKEEYCGPCPFCKDGIDRFVVWPDGGRDGLGHYWCRQCGERGDSAEWLIKKRHVGVVDAKLSRGIDVPEQFKPKEAAPAAVVQPETIELAGNPWEKFCAPATVYVATLPPRVDWLVYGVVEAATVVVAIGKPGDLKSMVLADMSLCVAAGKAWLGSQDNAEETIPPLQTRACKVAWVDCDQGRRRVHHRIHALARGHNVAGEGLDIYSLPPLDLARDEAFEVLYKIAKHGGYQMMILDTLLNVMPSIESENDNAGLSRAMSNLRRLADTTHTATIPVHHPNKAAKDARDSYATRGGSAITGAVDNVLNIRRDRTGLKDRLRIVAAKERGDVIDDLHLQWTLERDDRGQMCSARFYAIPKFEFGTESTNRNHQTEILSLLQTSGEKMDKRKIISLLGGKNETMLAAIDALVEKGQLHAQRDKDTKWKTVYFAAKKKF